MTMSESAQPSAARPSAEATPGRRGLRTTRPRSLLRSELAPFTAGPRSLRRSLLRRRGRQRRRLRLAERQGHVGGALGGGGVDLLADDDAAELRGDDVAVGA